MKKRKDTSMNGLGARSGIDASALLAKLPHRPSESAASYSYRTLEYNILMMRMPPGSVLRETALSERMGLSRTPVREAMGLLRDRGLVNVTPKSASHVSRISIDAVRQGCFLRSAVEPFVIHQMVGTMAADDLAALRANIEQQDLIHGADASADRLIELDDSFHHRIYQAAHKELIWKSVRRATGQFDRIRYLGLLSGYDESSPDAHRQIYELIAFGRRQSISSISELMEEHLGNYLDYLGELTRDYPEFFVLD